MNLQNQSLRVCWLFIIGLLYTLQHAPGYQVCCWGESVYMWVFVNLHSTNMEQVPCTFIALISHLLLLPYTTITHALRAACHPRAIEHLKYTIMGYMAADECYVIDHPCSVIGRCFCHFPAYSVEWASLCWQQWKLPCVELMKRPPNVVQR